MISPTQVRAFSLSLPGAEERPHFDHPSFRVRTKIFATLPDDDRAWVRVERFDMEALTSGDPATFEGKMWGATSWLCARLDRVDPDELCELITDAWRIVAPKKLIAAFDTEDA